MLRSSLLVLALVSLASVVGCASSSNDATAATNADLTTAAPACEEVSKPVTISLEQVASLECRPMKGQYVALDLEGMHFMDFISDDPEVCQAEVTKMRNAAWVGHGLPGFLISRCEGTHAHGDLVVDNTWHFEGWSAQ